jgi:hypothetical protein
MQDRQLVWEVPQVRHGEVQGRQEVVASLVPAAQSHRLVAVLNTNRRPFVQVEQVLPVVEQVAHRVLAHVPQAAAAGLGSYPFLQMQALDWMIRDACPHVMQYVAVPKHDPHRALQGEQVDATAVKDRNWVAVQAVQGGVLDAMYWNPAGQ